MKLSEGKLRNIIREEITYTLREEEIMNRLEDEISEMYEDYQVQRDGNLLLIDDDQGEVFKVALKNAMEVKPVLEVTYSNLEGSKNMRRKIFYLNQIDELKHVLKHRQF